MNRQNYSSKDTIGQDNKNVKGFWPTDFNQRSAPEQYKEEEAKSKTTLAISSSGKKIEEIHQALGKSVSKIDLDLIKIEIFDLYAKLNNDKKNWKLKGYIQALTVKLNVMTRTNDPKIINSTKQTIFNIQNETMYKIGSYVLVNNVLHTIKNIVDRTTFEVEDFITKESKTVDKKNIVSPNPILGDKSIEYNNIKKDKVDSMKDDVVSVMRSTTMGELSKINIKSSLGRSLMLFRINDFNLKKIKYDVKKVTENVVIQLFKMYFKLFYEDVIPINDMFIDLKYLLDNRTIELNEFDDIINETSQMVKSCVDFFHILFSDVEWRKFFLASLFGPLSGFIPPLKRKKFILDPFQVEVCDSISNKESFILVAPTSSGKSVLSTYVLHKADDGLVVIIVPDDSDVLAWQFASKIESEMGDIGKSTYVPIMTSNYKSVLPVYTERNDPKYKKIESEGDFKKKSDNEVNIFDKIRNCKAIVGTATEILNILPEIESKSHREIGYLIFDEIHTIDIDEGKDMEHISKIVGDMNNKRKILGKSEIPFMGLSATISNPEFLKNWYETIGWDKVKVIKCTQRFFNLQLHTTNSEGDIIKINPLSMVSIDDLIKDKNGNAPITSKEIDFTAIDVWELFQKINQYFEPSDDVSWNPYIKFDFILNQNENRFNDKEEVDNIISIPTTLNKMFELEDVKTYAGILIKVLVEYANDTKTSSKAVNLVSSLKPPNIETHKNKNVFEIFKKIEADNKTPAIAFMVNPSSCLRYAQTMYKLLRETNEVNLDNLESESEEKVTKADQKKARQEEEKLKEDAKKKTDAEKQKKSNKKICSEQMKGTRNSSNKQGRSKYKSAVDKGIDFKSWIPAESSTFLGLKSESDKNDYNEWFKTVVNEFNSKHIYESTNTQLFWLIDLLQFGIGVYVKGLAGSYLRLVQSLALQKKIKIVFSDKSLMFGVSMPFRTAIIFRDFYDSSKMPIDPMMFQQMGGRAGRRGEDTEGHIILSGYSWENICKLNVKVLPKLEGYKNNYIYTVSSCDNISDSKYGHGILDTNFLNKESDKDKDKFFEITKKIDSYAPINCNPLKYHRMMWRERDTKDSIVIPFILNQMIEYFKQHTPEEQKDQTEIAYFLCHFIHTRKSTRKNSLSNLKGSFKVKGLIEKLYKDLDENGIHFDSTCINSDIFRTISANKIQIKSNDIVEISNFKDEFLKFARKVIDIQHYCFYSAEPLLYCEMKQDYARSRLENMKKVSTLLGKLVTRLWWEYQLDPITILHKEVTEEVTEEYEVTDEDVVTDEEVVTDKLPLSFDVVNSEVETDKLPIIFDFLSENGINSKEILGDGNCLFRAISQAVYGTEDKHVELRKQAIGYINDNQDTLLGFIHDNETFKQYIKRLSQNGEFAGELEIAALKEVIHRPIYVYSNEHNTLSGVNTDLNGDNIATDIILLNYFDEINKPDCVRAGHYELFEGNITTDTLNSLRLACSESNDTLSVSSDSDIQVKIDEDLSTSETSEVSKTKGEGKISKSKKKNKKDSKDKKEKTKIKN